MEKHKPILHFDKPTIDKIRKRFSDRVAKIVVQSILTVIDVSYDPSTEKLVYNLIRAAERLRDIASGVKSFRKLDETRFCLIESEMLLRATRQRLSNVPPTRENNRLPFELPPPGVRVYYESCEFVIESLMSHFDKKGDELYKPFVVIDSEDNPKHTGLCVKMPEHRRGKTSVYPALSHEAFHSFVSQTDLITEQLREPISAHEFISMGLMPRMYQKFVEEIVVEILDCIFSFLGNFDEYMEDEWTFFARHFQDSLKENLEPKHMIFYVLRTFAVKLWSITQKEGINPSRIIELRPETRNLLKKHVQDIKDIVEENCKYTDLTFFHNVIYKLQHDIEIIADNLDVIFYKCVGLREKKKELINKMLRYKNHPETIAKVKNVSKGYVLNDGIQYPHIFVHMVSREVSQKKYNLNDDLRASMALIMTLWNARNILRSGKV
jgi:hypothetical protein